MSPRVRTLLLHTGGALWVDVTGIAGARTPPALRWHPDSARVEVGLAEDALDAPWWSDALAPAAHLLLALEGGPAPAGGSGQLALLLAVAVYRRALAEGWERSRPGAPTTAPPTVVFAGSGTVVAEGPRVARTRFAPVADWPAKLAALGDRLAALPGGTVHLFVPAAQAADVRPAWPPGWVGAVHPVADPAALLARVAVLDPHDVDALPSPARRGPAWAVLPIAAAAAAAWLAWPSPDAPDLRAALDGRPPAEAVALLRAIGPDGPDHARIVEATEGGVAATWRVPAEPIGLAADPDLLVVATHDGHLRAVDPATGEARWTVALEAIVQADVALVDDRVLAWSTGWDNDRRQPTPAALEVRTRDTGALERVIRWDDPPLDVAVGAHAVAVLTRQMLTRVDPRTATQCTTTGDRRAVGWRGDALLTSGRDGVVTSWTCADGGLVGTPVGAGTGALAAVGDAVVALDGDGLSWGDRRVSLSAPRRRLTVGPAHAVAWTIGGLDLDVVGPTGAVRVDVGDQLSAVAVLADRVATGTYGGRVDLWHARTGAHVRRLDGHAAHVYALAAVGPHLVSAGREGTVRRWWRALDGVRDVQRSTLPPGAGLRRAADGTAWIRTGIRAAEVVRVATPGVRPLAMDGRGWGTVASDGAHAVTLGRTATHHRWTVDGWVDTPLAAEHAVHTEHGTAEAGPDGIVVRDATGAVQLTVDPGPIRKVDHLVLHPDVLLATTGAQAWAWDRSTGTVRAHATLPGALQVAGLAWRDGTLAAWSGDPVVARGGPGGPALLMAHTDDVRHAAFLADGRLVTGAWDGTVRVWDGDTPVGTWDAGGPVEALAVGAGVVAVGGDALTLWDPDGRPVARLPTGGARVQALAIADDTLLCLTIDGVYRWFTLPWDADVDRVARGSDLRACPDGRVVAVVPFPGEDPWAPEAACR